MAKAAFLFVAVALASCADNRPVKAGAQAASTPGPVASVPSTRGWAPDQVASIAMDGLPEHELLYRLIAEQFVRLGWKTVCLSVAPAPGHQTKSAVDPPEDILKRLGVAGVRAGSSCRNDGDEVVVLGSNVKNAVAVTLAGADREGDDYLVRLYWCCWAGWGTLRFGRNADGWAFKGTEGWVQT